MVCAMTSYANRYSHMVLTGAYASEAERYHAITTALKWVSVAEAFGMFSGTCTRVSVCLFLLRIFNAVRAWRLGLYVIMAFVVAIVIPIEVSIFAQCSPTQKLWDPLVHGRCWSPAINVHIGYFNGGKRPWTTIWNDLPSFVTSMEIRANDVSATSTLCDWTLATLPIVFLWNVQMKRKVKIGICCLMGLGYL